MPRDGSDRPYSPPTIKTIKIIEPGHAGGMAHKSSGAQGGTKSSSQ